MEAGLVEREEPSGLLYHYTTLDGLVGILESDYLWATHVRYLNDVKEFRDALDHLDSFIDEFDAEFRSYLQSVLPSKIDYFLNEFGVYTVSFTDDERQPTIPDLMPGDRLNQWRSYSGKGNGISLGFDHNLIDKSNGDRVWKSRGIVAYLIDGVYQKDKKQELFQQLGRAAASRFKLDIESAVIGESAIWELVWPLLPAAACFKHPAFFEEKEWRIVISPSPLEPSEGDLVESPVHPVKFRKGVFGITPYIEFPLGLRSVNSPLRRVTVGPTPHIDDALIAVKALLAANGITNVEVAKSKIPYRNW